MTTGLGIRERQRCRSNLQLSSQGREVQSRTTGRAVEFLVINQRANATVIKDQADAGFTLGLRADRGPGIGRKKTPHAIGESRDRGGKGREQLESVRFVTGFLQQLSAGRLFGSLARFNMPGRQLEGDGGYRGPKLAVPVTCPAA